GQRAVRVELAPQRAERLAEVGGQGGGLVRVGRVARSGGGRVGHPAECTTGLRSRGAGYRRRGGCALLARQAADFGSRQLSEGAAPCDRNHAQNTAPDQLPKAPRNAQFDPTITPNTTREVTAPRSASERHPSPSKAHLRLRRQAVVLPPLCLQARASEVSTCSARRSQYAR